MFRVILGALVAKKKKGGGGLGRRRHVLRVGALPGIAIVHMPFIVPEAVCLHATPAYSQEREEQRSTRIDTAPRPPEKVETRARAREGRELVCVKVYRYDICTLGVHKRGNWSPYQTLNFSHQHLLLKLG